jgi:hypothetical protein
MKSNENNKATKFEISVIAAMVALFFLLVYIVIDAFWTVRLAH